MEIQHPQTKSFQRNIEDFVCEKCGYAVYGDGYRNHCPHCLVSKHVDIKPGDRAEECGGLMYVADITMDHGDLVLIHQCEKCGQRRRIRAHHEDSMDHIIDLMREFQQMK